jgi:MFS family permease
MAGSALAPSIGLFIAVRAFSGAANAFLTPLVLAGLADVTPRERLGRAVGTFAAVQTAAIALSPAVGGLLGDVDWRLAFLAPAAVAVVLSFVPPPDARRGEGAEPARLRSVFTPARRHPVGGRVRRIRRRDQHRLSRRAVLRRRLRAGSAARGAVLAGFGISGMLVGRPSGRLVDRLGRVPVTVAGALVSAVFVALIGGAGSVAGVIALWTAPARRRRCCGRG